MQDKIILLVAHYAIDTAVHYVLLHLLPLKEDYVATLAAGRADWLKLWQSGSITAAYIKESKQPAHDCLALVVMIDNAFTIYS